MCGVCQQYTGRFSDTGVVASAKRRFSLSLWCTVARAHLCEALENDPHLLLGGRDADSTYVATPRPLRSATSLGRRSLVSAGLRTAPILNADELLTLKCYFSSPVWEFLATSFSHYSVMRFKYHSSICTVCSGSYVCDVARDSPVELLTMQKLSVSATTNLFLEIAGLSYTDVEHLVQVDGDWVRTVVENEWKTLHAARPPRLDRRLSSFGRRRSFQVMMRALHKQRKVLRASRSTLTRCAYVALAAIAGDREIFGYDALHRLPARLRTAQHTNQTFGRNSFLKYSVDQNVFCVQTGMKLRCAELVTELPQATVP